MSELEELTKAELVERAKEIGLPFSGLNKAELIDALEAEVDAPEKSDLIPIDKRKSGRWWCPVCGHDQLTEVTTCEGCGAVREGTSVRPR